MTVLDAKEYYDTYWSDAGFYPHGHMTPQLASVLETHVPPGWACLDVGCGDGRSVGVWMSERGCGYTGVDISENAVADARELGLDARQINDVLSLPFDDASFEVVTFIEVLEHLFLPQLALRECLRLLKPGGVLIATVPNVAYWRRRADLVLFGRWNPLGDDRAVSEPWRDPHIRFFNPGVLKRMVAGAGFEKVMVSGQGGAFLRDLPWVGRRLADGGSSRVYRYFEERVPALFGDRLQVVGYKPPGLAVEASPAG